MRPHLRLILILSSTTISLATSSSAPTAPKQILTDLPFFFYIPYSEPSSTDPITYVATTSALNSQAYSARIFCPKSVSYLYECPINSGLEYTYTSLNPSMRSIEGKFSSAQGKHTLFALSWGCTWWYKTTDATMSCHVSATDGEMSTPVVTSLAFSGTEAVVGEWAKATLGGEELWLTRDVDDESRSRASTATARPTPFIFGIASSAAPTGSGASVRSTGTAGTGTGAAASSATTSGQAPKSTGAGMRAGMDKGVLVGMAGLAAFYGW